MGKTTTLSFPGLGIDQFTMNRTAFTVFGRPVQWYGIIITVGIIAAYFYATKRAKDEGINPDHVIDYALYCVIFGILGARAYYVLTSLDTMIADHFWGKYGTLYNIVAIWEGGLAIYGGIIAGFITAVIVTKIKKLKFSKVADMCAPAVMLGQIIGRWGNFVNGEAHGGLTDLPWRMGITNLNTGITLYYHPTFLYESLWNLVGFIIINIVYKKKRFDGQIFLMYMTWYGFGRMLIEGLRTDSLYVGPFRISQVVGFLSFITGAVLLIIMSVKNRGNGYALAAVSAENTASADKTEPTEDSAANEKNADTSEDKAPEKPSDASDKAGDTEKSDSDNESDSAKQ